MSGNICGIGVMFLMFAVSGRSAILIEERENGVLSRMLASHCTPPGTVCAWGRCNAPRHR